jgi:hypothetical protein
MSHDERDVNRSRLPWRRWLRRTSVALALLAVACMVYGFFIEPDRLRVEVTELDVPDLDESLTVVVLTDLHVGAPHIDLEKLEQVVDEANAVHPDLVVILGDLVIHGVKGGTFVEPEPIAAVLGRLEANLGVFAVLGNHDWWYDGKRVSTALTRVGIEVFENAGAHVRHGSSGIWVAGVADLWTREPDIDRSLVGAPNGTPVLLLTHSPDIFPRVPDRVALTLAGHTHGGQVRLPLVGPPIVPSKFGARYAAGHVVEDGRHLFVSTGVGTSILPVRFLVVPRVDVLRLH